MKRIHIAALYAVMALGLFVQCSQPPVHTITLLHHNDFHSAVMPDTSSTRDGTKYVNLGAPGLKGLADAVRDTAHPHLWLNAGDEYSGGVLSTLTEGGSQFRLAPDIGYDVAVLGNHEFDYGVERAAAFRDSAGIPVLGGANLVNADGQPFARTHIDTTIGGVKMRIIGLLPPDLEGLVGRSRLNDLQILDPAESVRKYLPGRKRLTVVLSHMGYTQDTLLASQVPEIDLIVGGHSHTQVPKPRLYGPKGRLMDEALQGDGVKRLGGTVITQAGGKGRYLGVITMQVRGGDIVAVEGQLLPNDGTLAGPDVSLLARVNEMNAKYSPMLDEKIATLEEPLMRAWDAESPLGRWMADAYRNAANADIGMHNNGGIRADLKETSLSIRDIWEVAPFGNEIVVFEVTGEQLQQIAGYWAKRDRIPMQVSGMSMTIDTSEDSYDGLTVQGKPVQKGKTYKVATNSYVFEQADGYFGLEGHTLNPYMTGLVDRDVLVNAARNQARITKPTDVRIAMQ
jgi:2',3'-cyclic-nucleotide 2'-phosphodiesterase (5'-nucleotidase family)